MHIRTYLEAKFCDDACSYVSQVDGTWPTPLGGGWEEPVIGWAELVVCFGRQLRPTQSTMSHD